MNSRIVLSLIACILLLGTAGVAYAGSVVTSIPVTSAGGVDVNPTTNIVYATSIGDSSVNVIDGNPGSPDENTVIATIPVGASPLFVSVNPITNFVYVTTNQGNTVSVIDGNPGSPDENTVIATIPVADGPNGIVVNPTENLIYVASGRAGTFTVIDGSTNQVIHSAFLAPWLNGITVDPTTNLVYVAQNNSPGQIFVMNGLSVNGFSHVILFL